MRARDLSLTLKVMPRDQETDVARDATVLVTAPRPLDQNSASGLRVQTDGRDVEGIVDVSSDGRILFWRPARTLDPRVRHLVTITGLRDDRGQAFDEHSSTFETGIFSYIDLRLGAE